MPTRTEVFAIADRIRARRERVSLRSVRAELPYGGSFRDIGKHLAAWKAERYQPRIEKAQLPEFLQTALASFGKTLWEAAMQEATRQFNDDRLRLEGVVKAERQLRDEALAATDALEAHVASLKSEVHRLNLERQLDFGMKPALRSEEQSVLFAASRAFEFGRAYRHATSKNGAGLQARISLHLAIDTKRFRSGNGAARNLLGSNYGFDLIHDGPRIGLRWAGYPHRLSSGSANRPASTLLLLLTAIEKAGAYAKSSSFLRYVLIRDLRTRTAHHRHSGPPHIIAADRAGLLRFSGGLLGATLLRGNQFGLIFGPYWRCDEPDRSLVAVGRCLRP